MKKFQRSLSLLAAVLMLGTVPAPVLAQEAGEHIHRYAQLSAGPTCTEPGILTYVCGCGHYYQEQFADALGHDHSPWETTLVAEADADGLEERSCARCGARQERIIAREDPTRQAHFSQEEWQVLKLVNRQRLAEGLEPLTGFVLMQQVAQLRAGELTKSFAHTRPDGRDCWSAYDEVGVVYESAAENIAGGYLNAEAVMNGWMGSAKHRQNILRAQLSSLGVGYHYAPGSKHKHYWVQDFRFLSGEFTDYRLVMPRGGRFAGGTAFDEMDIYLVLTHGTEDAEHYLPLTEEMVALKTRTGGMTVSFGLLGLKGSFEILLDPFRDVPPDSFYYEPVLWAVENGVTTGTSGDAFSPNGLCQRAQVVTFLWRAAGCPEPSSTENPFTDVKETDFYHKAVLWAVEEGITNGLTADTFGPYVYCNRAQVVTFLYRGLGSPQAGGQVPFADVAPDTWYTEPIRWAVENGITNGMGDGTFGVGSICNRAQVVTFLYRAYGM